MYIITCPNCGNQEVEETGFQEFECPCGEDFEISRATYDEEQLINVEEIRF